LLVLVVLAVLVVTVCTSWRAAVLCPAVAVQPGCGVFPFAGEQVQEWADPVSFLGGVPEQAVGVHRVPGTPPDPGAGEVTGCLQVGHDGLGGAFGDTSGGGDIPDPGLGVACDLHEHVPVPGQQRPAAATPLRSTHTFRS